MKIRIIKRELIRTSRKMSWHGIQYAWESRGIYTNFSSENMQGINHFIDLIIDMRIILKWVKYESVEGIYFCL
jgi:hypothetical protein